MRKQCYQTALGNCYGLKLPKCWLQFKKKILCHLLYFSAHCRYLLQWMQPRLSRYANNLQLRCLNAGATGILEWLCTERRLCSSICFRNLKCSTRMLSEKRWKKSIKLRSVDKREWTTRCLDFRISGVFCLRFWGHHLRSCIDTDMLRLAAAACCDMGWMSVQIATGLI